jgi:putative restriction endonuclease
MVKAVFTTKVSPVYDDLPEARYHFPRTYLRQVEASVGDWIVYYEPRRPTEEESSRGGRQAYFATARVDALEPDSSRDGHFYARVSQYLEFSQPVPFVDGAHFYEAALRKEDGSTNRGAFGRAVRRLTDAEYDLILSAGFARILDQERSAARPYSLPPGVSDPGGTPFEEEPETQQRRIVEQLISRPFRERAFVRAVKSAYRDTCAITGLRMINGGGRSEVQAAHIRPVADDGPDSVRNGLALSGTVHWMFDRGLLSIDDDYRLLVARGCVPDTIYRLVPEHGRVLVPDGIESRPHPQFLDFHRRNKFKG